MKYALILAIFISSYSFAATKKIVKLTPQAECWTFVQQTAKLDMEHEAAKDFDSVFAIDGRLHGCAEILKGYQSAFAQQLENLLISNRNEKLYREKIQALQEEQITQASLLAEKNEAIEKQTAITKAMVDSYNVLRTDYQQHLQGDITMAQQMQLALSQTAPARQGFFSNVLQGMNDAAKAEASRQTIHCTSTTWGNSTDTDCR